MPSRSVPKEDREEITEQEKPRRVNPPPQIPPRNPDKPTKSEPPPKKNN